MPVVTITTTKGGAGKTTSTVVLACGLAERGYDVGILDFDENQPIADWANKPINPPKGITIYPEVNRDNILDRLEEAAIHDFVLVDGEGSSSDEASFAICASDLVIIPLQKTQLDAKEATKAIRFVRMEERRIKRSIPIGLVMVRGNTLIPSRTQAEIEKAVRQVDLQGIGTISTLTVELKERAAYQAIFAYGGSVRSLPRDRGGNTTAAQANVDALVDAFLELVESLSPSGTTKVKRLAPAGVA